MDFDNIYNNIYSLIGLNDVTYEEFWNKTKHLHVCSGCKSKSKSMYSKWLGEKSPKEIIDDIKNTAHRCYVCSEIAFSHWFCGSNSMCYCNVPVCSKHVNDSLYIHTFSHNKTEKYRQDMVELSKNINLNLINFCNIVNSYNQNSSCVHEPFCLERLDEPYNS